jgi:hypothetical protein
MDFQANSMARAMNKILAKTPTLQDTPRCGINRASSYPRL